jgi:hypothetical protein
MKKLALSFLIAGLLLAAPRPAAAKMLELYLQVEPIGGLFGTRVGGTSVSGGQSSDFFVRNQGPMFGFKAGAKVLFIDAYFDFKQSFGGDGLGSTWLAGLLGASFDLNPGSWRISLGVHGGFGLGTTQTLDATSSDNKISQKGPVVQARAALFRKLAKVFYVGVEGNLGYHYLYLGGNAVSQDSWVHGMHYMVMAAARLSLGI